MIHTCHAPHCSRPCPPAMLMCPTCWALVTPEHQQEVCDSFTPGQELRSPGRRKIRPTKRWLAAVMRAKADVLDATGHDGSRYRGIAEAWIR